MDPSSAELAPLYAAEGQFRRSVRDLLAGVDLMLAFSTDRTGTLQHHLDDLVGGRATVFDPRPVREHRVHITEHLLDALQHLGVAATCRAPRVRVAESARCLAEVELRPYPRPLVMVHPGSGGERKCWPIEHFARLATDLRERGCSVVALCGPADAAQAQRMPPPLLRPADPMDLAAALIQADLFVGNDSGPGHVSAAVGTPTLSLFGPTDAAIWRPCGKHVRVLHAPSGSMARLEVDSAVQAALTMLRHSPQTS